MFVFVFSAGQVGLGVGSWTSNLTNAVRFPVTSNYPS